MERGYRLALAVGPGGSTIMNLSQGAIILAAASVVFTTFIERGLADDGGRLGSWLSQKTATGSWDGVRNELEAKGVTFSSNYTADFAGSVSGGERRGSGYAGVWEVGLGLDLEKFARFRGSSVAVNGFWASGKNVSADDIGNLNAVQEIFAPGRFYLGQLSLSQSLFEDTVTLQAGRLFAGDVFATSPLWDYYVSGGINDNLGSIASDIFFPTFQVAAWGARAFYQPTKQLGFIAGGYAADPTVAEPDKSGLDFGFDTSKGALILGQMTYQRHQSREEDGLPGSVTVGGYYESSRFSRLENPVDKERGNYGLYLYFDQMLSRGEWADYHGPEHLRAGSTYAARARHPYINQSAVPKDRPNGPTAWGALFVAPQDEINRQTVQVAGGLLYHALIPGRLRDVTALGVISGIFSEHLSGQGAETVIEANHRLQLTPWLYVTPDFQYVIHPNGFRHVASAAVFAGEVGLTF
jgi:porin